MTEKAYAKINLTLDVLSKREDGYHDIKTVMQTVSLYDEVEINKADNITISTNKSFLPTDKRNLVYMACERFFSYTGIKSGAEINLKKVIPVAAGLAGGSSDAAATLRALNRLYQAGLSDDVLCEIGASFGADIPFCIKGGTALCEGIGDRITTLNKLPELDVVISIGGEGMSTPVMYAEFDKKNDIVRPDTDGILKAIKVSDKNGIISRLRNVFEDICIEKRPFIADIKNMMYQNNALSACMSGSGPSVFGIFADKKSAVRCAGVLKKSGYFAYYCTTV